MEVNFNELNKYNNIFVTGCQRSGTRFFTNAITHDTGKTYVDEKDFGTHDIERLSELLKSKNNLVIHCPALAVNLEFLANEGLIKSGKDLVVWCLRDKKDVLDSMERLGWNSIWERAKYFNITKSDEDIYDVKNRYWKGNQKLYLTKLGREILEVKYEDYQNHKLWKSKEERNK